MAALPWLATELLAPAAVAAVALARWLPRRRQRGLAGFIALEVALCSAVVYITISDRLFGGLTPHDVAPRRRDRRLGPGRPPGARARAWRPRGSARQGLLLWTPFAALAGVALWRLWRSRRERLSVAVYDQVDVEVAAIFYASIVLAVWLTAVFAAPSLGGGGRAWADARHLVPALPALAALKRVGLALRPTRGHGAGGGDGGRDGRGRRRACMM